MSVGPLRLRMQLLVCSLLCCLLPSAEAGDYFCMPMGTRVDVNVASPIKFATHRVIPGPDGAVSNVSFSCRWEFVFNLQSGNATAILSGFNITKADFYKRRFIRSADTAHSQTPRMRYYMQHVPKAIYTCVSNESRSWKFVDERTQEILQVSTGDTLIVAYEQNSSSQMSTQGLNIQLMEPGFCTRETTNYDGKCYAITPVPRSTEEALVEISRYNGIVQLASFSSSSALQSFVTQSQRILVGSSWMQMRSKTPLNLTQLIRIGLFYDGENRSIYYQSISNAQCKIVPYKGAHKLFYRVESPNEKLSCGSLRAAQLSGANVPLGLVEFGDCGKPIHALIRFSDSARSNCDSCSSSLLRWIEDANIGVGAAATNAAAATKDNGNQLLTVIFSLVVLFVLLIVMVVCASVLVNRKKLYRRFCKDAEDMREEAHDQTSSPMVQSTTEGLASIYGENEDSSAYIYETIPMTRAAHSVEASLDANYTVGYGSDMTGNEHVTTNSSYSTTDGAYNLTSDEYYEML